MDKKIKDFDSVSCINSIRGLAKDKRINLGYLEEECGVSAGYLSRKEKDESSPSVEMIFKAAQLLDTSVDVLVNGGYGEVSPNEKKAISFLKKLVEETEDGELQWCKENDSNFQRYIAGEEKHPLFDWEVGDREASYCSSFREYGRIYLNGASFNARLGFTNNRVYIMNTTYIVDFESNCSERFDDIYEIYIVDEENGNANPLCTTFGLKGELSRLIHNLYSLIYISQSRISINRTSGNIIDSYLEGDFDELPF